ncbi:porin family protein [Lutimonas saemankumensis]|uniref:porin family protein n=1 Tax=Lutimonas saemankumensis TaxID=483016 RepID=UPI001CD49D9E|nr:porin family protein [Lutimonas saemankumensis]MCA0933031.1 porin family protein [Lutimonas saemankumensis]
MKKLFITFILCHLGLISTAQIEFEPGHYLDENGNQISGYIKNIDWKNNPSRFEFKSSTDSPSKTITANEATEFYVSGNTFKKYSVQIDRSSSDIDKLSWNKQPQFKEELLFLRLEVQGSLDLYSYYDKNTFRYFMGEKEKAPEQLVYKKYRRSSSEIGSNNLYKQQLIQVMKCDGIKKNRFEQLEYTKKSMIKIFEDYNQCVDPSLNYQKETRKGVYRLSIRPGVSFNSYNLSSSYGYIKEDVVTFDNMVGFRLGVEIEHIFPFNKNKWSLLTEPSFNFVKGDAIDKDELPSSLSYTSFELPVGLRHYFFLNDKNKLYLNANLILVFPINSSVSLENQKDFEFEKGTNYSVSLGLKMSDKFSIEYQYKGKENWAFDRGLIRRTSSFGSMALILGYNIF